MRRHSPSRRWRAAVVFAVAAVCAGTAATASAGTGPGAGGVNFAADSFNPRHGDLCPLGATEGRLDWDGPVAVIRVRGSLVDRPVPGDDQRCADDRRFSEVTFTSFRDGRVTSVTTYTADNEVLPFDFTVPLSTSVEVRVCRHSDPPAPEDYCGRPHEIPIPIIIP